MRTTKATMRLSALGIAPILVLVLLAGVTGLIVRPLAAAAASRPDLRDAPVVWFDDDRRDIPRPAERKVSLTKDLFHTTVVRPVRRVTRFSTIVTRLVGDRYGPSQNANALGEVPSSSWFTNRMGLFPMSSEDVRRGTGPGTGPSRAGKWEVIGAKTEGVTPGFRIQDADGVRFLIKFDPLEYPGVSTRAGVVCARIFHAAGYFVPDDAMVTFRRDDLELGTDVKVQTKDGKRAMTRADLDAILARVPEVSPGEYLAISSRFLPGVPVGFFDYKNRREDDPNDRVNHQFRRELRGLRMFAAWLRHYDTKQGNTLDTWVEEDGARHVRHHLIDFASTLGTGAEGPAPKYGMEYGWDTGQFLGRLLSVGLHEDEWRKLVRPEGLDEIGYFEAAHFDPMGFKPLTPNIAFAYMDDEDGYWAAKIISAFRREHLEAAVAAAEYRNPEAARYLVDTLEARRDIIAREFFRKVAPLDFFRLTGGGKTLEAIDLGVDRALWTAAESRYRYRAFGVARDREPTGAVPSWRETGNPRFALPGDASPPGESGGSFVAVEIQVARGVSSGASSGDREADWGPSVTAYVARSSGRVVAVDR